MPAPSVDAVRTREENQNRFQQMAVKVARAATQGQSNTGDVLRMPTMEEAYNMESLLNQTHGADKYTGLNSNLASWTSSPLDLWKAAGEKIQSFLWDAPLAATEAAMDPRGTFTMENLRNLPGDIAEFGGEYYSQLTNPVAYAQEDPLGFGLDFIGGAWGLGKLLDRAAPLARRAAAEYANMGAGGDNVSAMIERLRREDRGGASEWGDEMLTDEELAMIGADEMTDPGMMATDIRNQRQPREYTPEEIATWEAEQDYATLNSPELMSEKAYQARIPQDAVDEILKARNPQEASAIADQILGEDAGYNLLREGRADKQDLRVLQKQLPPEQYKAVGTAQAQSKQPGAFGTDYSATGGYLDEYAEAMGGVPKDQVAWLPVGDAAPPTDWWLDLGIKDGFPGYPEPEFYVSAGRKIYLKRQRMPRDFPDPELANQFVPLDTWLEYWKDPQFKEYFRHKTILENGQVEFSKMGTNNSDVTPWTKMIVRSTPGEYQAATLTYEQELAVKRMLGDEARARAAAEGMGKPEGRVGTGKGREGGMPSTPSRMRLEDVGSGAESGPVRSWGTPTKTAEWIANQTEFDSLGAVAAAKSGKIKPGGKEVIIRVNGDGTLSMIDGAHKLKDAYQKGPATELPVKWVDENFDPIAPGFSTQRPTGAGIEMVDKPGYDLYKTPDDRGYKPEEYWRDPDEIDLWKEPETDPSAVRPWPDADLVNQKARVYTEKQPNRPLTPAEVAEDARRKQQGLAPKYGYVEGEARTQKRYVKGAPKREYLDVNEPPPGTPSEGPLGTGVEKKGYRIRQQYRKYGDPEDLGKYEEYEIGKMYDSEGRPIPYEDEFSPGNRYGLPQYKKTGEPIEETHRLLTDRPEYHYTGEKEVPNWEVTRFRDAPIAEQRSTLDKLLVDLAENGLKPEVWEPVLGRDLRLMYPFLSQFRFMKPADKFQVRLMLDRILFGEPDYLKPEQLTLPGTAKRRPPLEPDTRPWGENYRNTGPRPGTPAGHPFPMEEGKYIEPVKPAVPTILEQIIEAVGPLAQADPALYAELERYFRNLPR